MKKKIKIFLNIILVLLFLISLTSCQYISSEYQEFKKRYLELFGEYTALKEENNDLEKQYARLNEIYENYANILEDETETFSLFSQIENTAIKSSLLITEKEIDYNWYYYTESNSLGSGFVIKEDNNYYYALTNSHVVSSTADTSGVTIYVTDYDQNTYRGQLLYRSANYDMAIVRFRKNSSYEALPVVKLASENPKYNDTVIAIGNPHGQLNSVGIGKVKAYQVPNYTHSSVSSVSYQAIVHSAYMLPGNSGGMLLNENLEVVGINTWGSENSDYDNYEGLASPVDKIRIFLDACGIEVE